jgi:hypothetical protein
MNTPLQSNEKCFESVVVVVVVVETKSDKQHCLSQTKSNFIEMNLSFHTKQLAICSNTFLSCHKFVSVLI